MPKKTEPPKITFVNQPNVGRIWETLLNLLAEEKGWDCRFTCKATLKEEYQKEETQEIRA